MIDEIADDGAADEEEEDDVDPRLCFEDRARMRGACDAVWRTTEGWFRDLESWDRVGGWMSVEDILGFAEIEDVEWKGTE